LNFVNLSGCNNGFKTEINIAFSLISFKSKSSLDIEIIISISWIILLISSTIIAVFFSYSALVKPDLIPETYNTFIIH
jgi:hypothetical protein